jgi:hypothetical protein
MSEPYIPSKERSMLFKKDESRSVGLNKFVRRTHRTVNEFMKETQASRLFKQTEPALSFL